MKLTCALVLSFIALPFALALSQEIKPIPEGASTTKLVRLHIVAGDYVSTSVVEVDSELFDKLPVETEPKMSAASYRLKADHGSCEDYAPVGKAFKASDTQLAIVLDSKAKGTAHLLAERLTTADSLHRHAILIFASKTNDDSLSFAGKTITEFAGAIQPRVDAGGLIAYPVDLGVRPLATTCKCKSFFGCTSGCCTDPTCNVVVGFCQSNSDCKKVDLTSSCSCQ